MKNQLYFKVLLSLLALTILAAMVVMDIPVILTPHSGHIDPPVDFGLKR